MKKWSLKEVFSVYFLSRLDWHIYPETWLFWLSVLLIIPAELFLPEEYGYENSLIENAQMVLLLGGMIICFFAKREKPLFMVVAFFLFLMALREVNFGKVLFYPDPDHPNEFLSWREIWYAPYVDPALAVMGIAVAIFALKAKLWNPILAYLLKISIPVWSVIGMAIMIPASFILDKAVEDCVLEEIFELSAYTAIIGVVSLYAFRVFLPDSRPAECAVAGVPGGK